MEKGEPERGINYSSFRESIDIALEKKQLLSWLIFINHLDLEKME